MTDRVALLGFPFDAGASGPRGAAAGPEAIRARLYTDAGNGYSLSGEHVLSDAILTDLGDAQIPDTREAGRREIEQAAREASDRGQLLALGGDHSITLPLMRAAAARFGPLHVLHFDAHPDLYPELDGQRFSNASPFVRGLEEGVIAKLLQVGIRANTPPQAAVAEKFANQIMQFSPDELDAIPADFLEHPRYLSLDIDALDPAFAPGVAHPEAGGLTVRELLGILDSLGRGWVAADLVEVVPERDVADLTAVAAARLVKELIALRSS